ncbi:MAG: alpha-galactosidase [Bifidobacteriaceae bacterium]|jgi:alpha-galactosidase|nr:alpha-galactosidase [Bifidobacteriaceae bacterium]
MQFPPATGPQTDSPSRAGTPLHLRAGGVSLVLDLAGPALPRVLYWGRDLGELGPEDLAALEPASRPGKTPNRPDEPFTLTLLPENSHSWVGTPGLAGHRRGRDFSTRFQTQAVEQAGGGGSARHAAPRGAQGEAGAGGGQAVVVRAVEPDAELDLKLEVELAGSGLIRMRGELANNGEGRYTLDGMTLAMPVPGQAGELLDFGGHWAHEREPQRHPFPQGTWAREGRRGRTGHDATPLLIAGEPGFGFRHGQVWAVHTAWSGNHRTLAERLPGGERILAGGELPLPGEIQLEQGQSYTSPWVYFGYGDGLDDLAARFHRFIRGWPARRRQPRPVTGNSWEAVYFNHQLEPLIALAEAFAEVGVERFVLDDGWFRHRRDDKAGLGDWHVDQAVWPDGLHPLADRVRELGMDFGLWVEPEMVNADSDLARAHPDWIMAAGRRLPPESRHQQVLNLGNPAALAHIKERLDALVDEYQVAFLKWDHNRDLVEPGDQATGKAGVHAQTEAVYQLWDYLKERHPGLEIETCASGGGRVDLGILSRADRVWTSDCTDARERQAIQRHTGLLVPPEFLGAHISADPNHQTGRSLPLAMRAVTAMFGDLGIEWDIRALDAPARQELAAWVAVYKQWRGLLHAADAVHADHPDPAFWVHGRVAPDKSRALFAIVPRSTSAEQPPGQFRPVGLDPARRYRVEPLAISRPVLGWQTWDASPWWEDGIVQVGRVLMERGLRTPDLPPDTPVLISFTGTGG